MDSSTVMIIAAIVILALVVVAALLLVRRGQSHRLQSRFGAEYERAVEDAGSRRKAEAELHDRQKRVSHFDIKPLAPSDRDRFVSAWTNIQAEFVDQPQRALAHADTLIAEVMKRRGYPVESFEQSSADLSVDHASVVQNYRAGRDIAVRQQQGQADTEDLRQAMIHYRALFDELVSEVDANAERRAS